MITFKIDHDGAKHVAIHASLNVHAHYHQKKEDSPEFVVIDHYDYEKKEWAQVFIRGEALDKFLEEVMVISALRFKN